MTIKIKELPSAERPYEKLELYGEKNLSNAELLAIIIKSGTKEETSVQLAQKILKLNENAKEDNLNFLRNISIEELMQIKGIGKVKAIQLKAVCELGVRMSKPSNYKKIKIKSPADIAKILMNELRYEKKEIVKLIILNNKNEIQIKDNINVNLESDSNSLIIEEREIKLNDGKKINLQFVSTADMQKDAKDLSIKFLPYSLFISILFSAIISLIYAKSIKNNLQEIKIVTDKMMKLDKKTRLKVSSNDEVGELKQQINDLYSTLLRTIDNLEFKNKEILKLEKLKYDFFKGASHELKTPLASLKIILENMKYNIGKYKERDIYINECIDIVDSLTKNISQILSVHSIENLNNDEEYLKINDTLEDILKKYEILANQKKITVNNYISDENIYIGKTALKIILSNLISNAIKYTDVNGVINIGIVDDWLYIENSYGNNRISNMDEIFDVKFDLNKENSNGLGLYIVSNILNNYNIEYKALQDEEFFIFKIKIFS